MATHHYHKNFQCLLQHTAMQNHIFTCNLNLHIMALDQVPMQALVIVLKLIRLSQYVMKPATYHTIQKCTTNKDILHLNVLAQIMLMQHHL